MPRIVLVAQLKKLKVKDAVITAVIQRAEELWREDIRSHPSDAQQIQARGAFIKCSVTAAPSGGTRAIALFYFDASGGLVVEEVPNGQQLFSLRKETGLLVHPPVRLSLGKESGHIVLSSLTEGADLMKTA